MDVDKTSDLALPVSGTDVADGDLTLSIPDEGSDPPRISLAMMQAASSLAGQFSQVFLRESGLFPFRAENGAIWIAAADPNRPEPIDALRLTLAGDIAIATAAREDIETILDLVSTRETETEAQAGDSQSPDVTAEDAESLRDLASGAPVVQALEQIFERAVTWRGTDIHIEPLKRELRVRIRVDGILRLMPVPQNVSARALVSRVKILSGLNIAEHRLPQDGRARMQVRGREFDLRVATMPTMGGEAAILRLLERNSTLVAFGKIGFSPRDEAVLRRQLGRPHGLLIVTGPTGSGKTTTLAASIAEMNDTSRKILTIEDPVEYELPGVSQSQVRSAIGLTFANALRAFLRQDPDVIMVGEIRDGETASIAMQASLTGHLVLSTLHTNSAAAALNRLTDLGIEPFLVASTLTTVVAQRLARNLCPDCKKPAAVTQQDLEEDPRLTAFGFEIGTILHHAVGCERCAHTGYRGRGALFEVLEITDEIRRLILNGADEGIIVQTARTQGMQTMLDDGLARCRLGQTTIDEVFRVVAQS
ncbi:GspE/PulE family protein [Beijerinckia indica]|nr:GspE/PulE family protein [Beijerinckia indica]